MWIRGWVVVRLVGGIGLVFVSLWWIDLLGLLVEFGRRLCVGGECRLRFRRGGVRLRRRVRKVCRDIRLNRGVLDLLVRRRQEGGSGVLGRCSRLGVFCSFRGRVG